MSLTEPMSLTVAEPESKVTALCVAAEHQRTEMVRQLLALQADVNCTSASGNTALHFAARSGNPDVLALLREAGACCAVRGIASNFKHRMKLQQACMHARVHVLVPIHREAHAPIFRLRIAMATLPYCRQLLRARWRVSVGC